MEYLSHLVRTINTHRPEIYLISLVVFALFAFTMWAASQRAKNERWMRYFSCAFAVLSLQYSVLLALWAVDTRIRFFSYAVSVSALQILSTVNNLFFIGAARNLQNKESVWPEWIKWLAGGTVVTTLAGFAFVTSDNWLLLLLQRSVDTIFSALSIASVGFAIFANVSIQRSQVVSRLALVVAGGCAFVYVLYGLNPLLSHLSSGYSFSVDLLVLDSLVWAVALPLKGSLCAATFLLMLRYFETFNDLTKLQDLGIGGRQDYLSSEGMVRVISERLKGNVNILIMLPSQQDRRIACISWPNADPQKGAKIISWPNTDSLARTVLRYSEEVIWKRGEDRGGNDEPRKSSGRMSTIIAVPIKTHGATIGCLQVARYDFPFSQMAIRQIRELANIISPAVQSYRELAALDQLSIKFAQEQNKETCDPGAAANKLATIIHDIFSPVALYLHMTSGFTDIGPVYLGKANIVGRMKKEIDGSDWPSIPGHFFTEEITSFKLLKKRLTARSVDTLDSAGELNKLQEERLIIGSFVLAVHEKSDYPMQPTLGTNYLHRKAAATLAADAYLDLVFDYYNDLLKRFGLDIGQPMLSVEQWFELVKETAEDAGLLWVVVEEKDSLELLGPEEAVGLVRALKDEQHEPDSADTTSEIKIRRYLLPEPVAMAQHTLQLSLPASGGRIWLGVSRRSFGPELSFSSPWKMFLLNYAQVADAALDRISTAGKVQRMQIEAAQYQGLATAAVAMGTMAHQLSNLVHGQSASISTLLDAISINRLTTDEDLTQLIHSMKGSAEQMRRLLLSLTNVTRTDERRPCQLAEAVEQARKLFAVSLLQRGISLDVDVSSDLYLDVPFNVAALAIANLVGNAKDEMSKGGTIRVEAVANGNMALCRVIDQGKGVPIELREKIFELGYTNKESGSGWGLYLTSRSLLENRSHVELTRSDERGSVFTIRFPMPEREEAR